MQKNAYGKKQHHFREKTTLHPRSHPMAGIGPVPRGTRARLGPFITLTLLARSA